jgi:HK97 family phage major capsid protein
MTIEELLAALQAILDEAGAETLTDDQVARYEKIEVDLAAARKDLEVRSRQTAYTTPIKTDLVHTGAVAKPDDGLERAFEAFLRTGVANADITELRAQGAGTGSAGGYMVPPGFRQKLVEVQKAFGGLAPEVDGFSTDNGAPVQYPSVDDTANVGQITAEGAAFAGGADLPFGTINLGAWKYTSAGAGGLPLKVSVELLQDAAFDVQGLVSRKLGERIARKEALDWVTGAGTTLPFGIARAGLTANVTLAAGNAITYQKLLDIESALDPAYEQNAKWIMNKQTWQNIRAVLDSSNRPLIQNAAVAGMGDRPQRQLLGYDVIIDQAFPTNTTLSAKFAVLGDLRESYVIRRVSNVVVMVNPYSSAASGQVEFTAWERADGAVQNRGAYSLAAANAA